MRIDDTPLQQVKDHWVDNANVKERVGGSPWVGGWAIMKNRGHTKHSRGLVR